MHGVGHSSARVRVHRAFIGSGIGQEHKNVEICAPRKQTYAPRKKPKGSSLDKTFLISKLSSFGFVLKGHDFFFSVLYFFFGSNISFSVLFFS